MIDYIIIETLVYLCDFPRTSYTFGIRCIVIKPFELLVSDWPPYRATIGPLGGSTLLPIEVRILAHCKCINGPAPNQNGRQRGQSQTHIQPPRTAIEKPIRNPFGNALSVAIKFGSKSFKKLRGDEWRNNKCKLWYQHQQNIGFE